MKTSWLIGAASLAALGFSAPGLAQQPQPFAGPAHAGPAGGPGGPGGQHGMRGRGGPGAGPGGALGLLRAADADGDLSITRAELDGLNTEMFDWLDRNGDGVLDEADRSPLERRVAALRVADAPDGADDADRPRERRGPEARLDADEDGSVSRAEYVEGQARAFVEMEADGDGVLTPDEIDAHLEDRRESRRWWRDR